MVILGLFIYAIDGIVAFQLFRLYFLLCQVVVCRWQFHNDFCYYYKKTNFWGSLVSGWPSLVCIMCFIAGIQLFCMGIVGMYMSKTYTETKKRPIYILRTSYRCKENSDKR